MGAVYRAEHIHMKKTVALKVLHREMTALPEVVARFEQEAVAGARIEHPNVVQARDFGRLEDGAFYLVLDYVEGRSLSEVMQDRMPLPRVLAISGQIAEALEAAHQNKIVHRDLKPDNVMLVERDGEPEIVKVLDFGIAKVSLRDRGHSDRPITKTGTVFGTPEYMSPEQAAGQKVDYRGDIYSLGVLMYEMLSGGPPFTGDEVGAILLMQITQTPPPLPSTVPLAVRQLVGELLSKEPNQRPHSAAEVVQRILALLGAQAPVIQSKTRTRLISVRSYPRITWIQRLDSGPWGRRVTFAGLMLPAWRLGALVFGLTGLGFGVALVVLGMRSPNEPPPPVKDVRPIVVETPVHPPAAAPKAEVRPAANPEQDKLLGLAFLGDPKALEALEARPEASRSAREWISIAAGREKAGREMDALEAYKKALEREPNLGEDQALRKFVWEVSRKPEAGETAMRLMADYFGSKGADMLYRSWVESREVTPVSQLARELVYTKRVRASATPGLAFVLDWREAVSCDDYVAILPRAQLNADQRALMVLQRALRKNPCKLPEETLQAAIVVAKERPEPVPW
jgi:serine/threonine-protein kinase